MKIKNELMLREIAGNYIIVPVGGDFVDLNAMININDTGAFIFKALEEDTTASEIVDAMIKEYDIDEKTAKNDVNEFIDILRKNSMLEE